VSSGDGNPGLDTALGIPGCWCPQGELVSPTIIEISRVDLETLSTRLGDVSSQAGNRQKNGLV